MARHVKNMARAGDERMPAAESRWLAALGRAPLRLPLFARDVLDASWRLERRVIAEHLLYFATKGACVGQVGGTAVELSAGSLLWVPPGLPFEFTLASPRRPLSLLRFRLAVDGARWPEHTFILLTQAWEMRPAFDGVLDELTTDLPYRDALLRAHLVTLFAEIFRARGRPDGTGGRAFNSAQTQRLMAFAAKRLRERPGAADLAAELGLSHDYFTRLFRQTFGLAPRAWLLRERVRQGAMRLLDSDARASEIAEELGYPDLFAFSRQFKQVFGCSPRAYRRTH